MSATGGSAGAGRRRTWRPGRGCRGPGVSAIETGRLVPSAAAALALAAALGCRVEDLFRLRRGRRPRPRPGPGPPRREPCRYWQAEVGGRPALPGRIDPARAWSPTTASHRDGDVRRARRGPTRRRPWWWPAATRPSACSPTSWPRSSGVRLIALAAVEPGGARPARRRAWSTPPGSTSRRPTTRGATPRPSASGSAPAIACSGSPAGRRGSRRRRPAVSARSARRSRADLRWVGREDGSGARQCLDELLGGRRKPPRRLASDHRGVAEAVRSGWADAGVCLRLAGRGGRPRLPRRPPGGLRPLLPRTPPRRPRLPPSSTPSAPRPTAAPSATCPATTGRKPGGIATRDLRCPISAGRGVEPSPCHVVAYEHSQAVQRWVVLRPRNTSPGGTVEIHTGSRPKQNLRLIPGCRSIPETVVQ